MRTSLALALLLLASAGCKAEPRAAPRPDAEAAPTPEQDVALRSPLHRLHLDAKEPAACADCHRIEGPKVFSKTRRCLGCHEKKPLGEGIAPAGGLTPPITGGSAVHRGATSDDARECMTCHDFLAATKDPWACAHCHTAEGQRARSSKEGDWASKAPLIKVHAAEACKLCHAPHGEEALHLADCASCHPSSFASHHPAAVGPAQCVECHVGHLPKETASERCQGCHETKQLKLPGHPRCVSCHEPHGAGAGTRPCASCHQDGHAREMFGAFQPRACKSCHDPHQSIHTGGGTARPGPCSSCHLEAASDTAFHGDQVPCSSCHTPGQVWTPPEPDRLCARCHGGAAAAGGAVKVKTAPGHARCTGCHLEAHEPRRAAPPCASCHEAQRASAISGHDACADCHRTHEGTLKKRCADCHAPQAAGPHRTPAERCTDCHRAHGPKGAEAPLPCAKCHASPLPGLHGVPQHRSCPDCHQFHEAAPAGGRASCVGACHEAQRAHYLEATSCRGCHAFKGVK